MKTSSTLVTIGAIAAILILAAVAIILSTPRQASLPPVPGTPRTQAGATAKASPTARPVATSIVQAVGTPVPGAMLRVWSSMCVAGVPYMLVSIPLDASFALVQAESNLPATSIPITGITTTPSAVPTFSTPSFVGGTAAPFPTATLTVAEATAIVPLTGSESSRGTLGVLPTQNSCTTLGQQNGLQMVMCTGPEGNILNLYVREGSKEQLYQSFLWDCSVASNSPVPTLSKTPPVTIVSPSAVPSTIPPTLPATLPPPTIVPPTPVPPTSPPTVPPATATP